MAVHRSAAAVANWGIAVLAAAALLLVPVTPATTGGGDAHAHALLHVLLDGADGSYDHHDHDHDHDHGDDDAADRSGPGHPSNAEGAGAHPSDRHAGAPEFRAPGRAILVGAADIAAGHDHPVVSAYSVAAKAGAMPLADPSARPHPPSPAAGLLVWSAVGIPDGVALDPFSPPPRGGSAT